MGVRAGTCRGYEDTFLNPFKQGIFLHLTSNLQWSWHHPHRARVTSSIANVHFLLGYYRCNLGAWWSLLMALSIGLLFQEGFYLKISCLPLWFIFTPSFGDAYPFHMLSDWHIFWSTALLIFHDYHYNNQTSLQKFSPQFRREKGDNSKDPQQSQVFKYT